MLVFILLETLRAKASGRRHNQLTTGFGRGSGQGFGDRIRNHFLIETNHAGRLERPRGTSDRWSTQEVERPALDVQARPGIAPTVSCNHVESHGETDP